MNSATGLLCPSYATLQKKTGLGRQSIDKALACLERTGILRIARRLCRQWVERINLVTGQPERYVGTTQATSLYSVHEPGAWADHLARPKGRRAPFLSPRQMSLLERMQLLWADLKAASKTEFESELAKAQETIAKATADADTPPPPPARPPRSRGLRSASPAARIVHRLTEEVGLSEREAALTAGLREKGVDAAKIPGAGGENLTQWVEALLERVSGAVVMGAAQRIEKP